MKQHVSVLGALYIVFGAFALVAAIAILGLLGGLAGVIGATAGQDPDAAVIAPILGIVGVVIFGIVTLLSIPGLAAGIGLIKFKAWARILALVLSAINLLNFPFGTALGAYGLWVLLNKDTEALFQ